MKMTTVGVTALASSKELSIIWLEATRASVLEEVTSPDRS
jgi:hypothetical protein